MVLRPTSRAQGSTADGAPIRAHMEHLNPGALPHPFPGRQQCMSLSGPALPCQITSHNNCASPHAAGSSLLLAAACMPQRRLAHNTEAAAAHCLQPQHSLRQQNRRVALAARTPAMMPRAIVSLALMPAL
eukprot:COSAG01_NODE_54_length_31327_cov_317.045356_8_plen_130_part_00